MDHHAIRMLTDVSWKPWVLTGGSYSGALAAWTESIAPGTFWAYHASSAPVEAIYDFVRDVKDVLTKHILTYAVAIFRPRHRGHAQELQQGSLTRGETH
jgi:hypothetical protein